MVIKKRKKKTYNYEDYESMIHDRAKHYSNSPCQYEDFVSEGNIVFVESLQKFDSSRRVKFSTFLHRNLSNRYLRIIGNYDNAKKRIYKRYKLAEGETIETLAKNFSMPHLLVEFRDACLSLGECAKEGIRLLLDNPADELQANGEIRAKSIKKKLEIKLKETGYHWDEIKFAKEEIKSIL